MLPPPKPRRWISKIIRNWKYRVTQKWELRHWNQKLLVGNYLHFKDCMIIVNTITVNICKIMKNDFFVPIFFVSKQTLRICFGCLEAISNYLKMKWKFCLMIVSEEDKVRKKDRKKEKVVSLFHYSVSADFNNVKECWHIKAK